MRVCRRACAMEVLAQSDLSEVRSALNAAIDMVRVFLSLHFVHPFQPAGLYKNEFEVGNDIHAGIRAVR